MIATMDVCIDEQTPIVFCDKERYDLVPFRMIAALRTMGNNENFVEEVTQDLKKLQIHYEISITERNLEETQTRKDQESKIEEEDRDNHQFYDALDEFEEFEDSLEPIALKLKNGKEIKLPSFLPEQRK